MTVTQLKQKLESLEARGLGDIEVYFNDDMHVSKIDLTYVNTHYPVVVLEGIPMEDDGDFCLLEADMEKVYVL